MSGNQRERMSSVDTAWLRMDRPSNLMMICGVLIFRERVTFARLKKTLTDRFLRFERFRQRPLQTPAGSSWQTDDEFDIANHLERVALPGRAGKAELEALVSKLAGTPLDPAPAVVAVPSDRTLRRRQRAGRAHPPLLRRRHRADPGDALAHRRRSRRQCRGPGAAATERKRGRRSACRADRTAGRRDAIRAASRIDADRKRRRHLARPGARGRACRSGRGVDRGDRQARRRWARIRRRASRASRGIAKRVAWADPVPLAEVKAIGRAYDCSINDVLLSSVAGALRSYLQRHGDAVDGLSLRALVPVNLRPPEKAYKLGNRFGLVFLDLPLGIANPVERLYAVRANMQALKGSYQPVLSLGILAAMGAGPEGAAGTAAGAAGHATRPR